MTSPAVASPVRQRPTMPRVGGPAAWLAGILAWLAIWYFLVGPQQVANALTIGAIYALVALGYTMVYGIIELINFAHGDIFMVGAFVALTVLANFLGQTGAICGDMFLLIVVLAVAIAVSMVVI